ncbi:MAG: maleylpyruvate isomerase family mycothiol-dependent enzyme [Propionibacteriaceae bacterium]|nr:maleylpyruvate isomerase family mycothiol-dependent enzyme [Propionibacteriaceae bacterium]
MDLWHMIHAARADLADDLTILDEDQWAARSLCGNWSVREVVAHLSAAASVGRLRWFRSVVEARFDFDLHNQRRLSEHLGATPADTLQEFRRIIPSTTAPMGPAAAWLGEVIVHSADIQRPLGIDRTPEVAVVEEVARFYASRDFAVPSHKAIRGLRLEATDGTFSTGDGPVVSGTTLALTMAMAGRTAFCDDLTGDGIALLRSRCPTP